MINFFARIIWWSILFLFQTFHVRRNLTFCKEKKKRKTPEDIIILHMCTKDLDDMIYSSSDMECDRLKLVIMGNYLPF